MPPALEMKKLDVKGPIDVAATERISFNEEDYRPDYQSRYIDNLIEQEGGERAFFDEDAVSELYANLSDASHHLLLVKTGHGNDVQEGQKSEAETLPFDIKYILGKIQGLTDEKTIEIMNRIRETHEDDTNFPVDDWEFINNVLDGTAQLDESPETDFAAKLLAVLVYYHSPYPEVRAVTDLIDNPNEPVETIRSYFIALIWIIIAAGIREFFSHRLPSIALTSGLVAILMYPCGKAWEFIIPKWSIPWFGGARIPLNPGPYSYKEQMFATTLISVASSNVYVSYNIVTQRKFYGETWLDFGFQFLLVISTQLMGFSFAGILRRFVIYPVRAVWPTNLPTIALNRALLKPERKETIHGWTISKYKFFWVVFASMFVYFWLPDYIFQALSIFNWMTWIKPFNFNLATITGGDGGLGLNPIPTFDWNIANALIAPLAIPFYVTMNNAIGMFIGFFVIIGIYYSNYKWTAYLPINSNGIFTNTGDTFEVQEILTNGLLDSKKYQSYSPPFYTAANIFVYSAFFFVYPFTFLYNCAKEYKTLRFALNQIYSDVKETLENFSLKKAIKPQPSAKTLSKYDDPHCKMMSRYKEIPDWYFVLILIVSLVLAIICVEVYGETNTPVWGIFFTIGINFVFLIPLCLLYAVTGIQLGLNVLVELIVGYALPGNGVAMMTLKALGYNIDGQADNFVSSQKTAHYAKIPPRALFRGQLVGVVVQAFVFLGVVNWSMSNIEGMCDTDQPQKFTCPNERTYYSASVLWGVIGPKRVFGELYPVMKYAFLMGFLVALLFIAIKFFTPKLFPKYFEPSVMITGMLNYAPYNLSYIIPGVYVSFVFMFYVKKRYLSWFEKYNYVLSAALDAGVAFSAVIIFFSVQYHPKDIDWWGNSVSYAGVDGGNGRQTLYNITATEKGYFGPDPGNYP